MAKKQKSTVKQEGTKEEEQPLVNRPFEGKLEGYKPAHELWIGMSEKDNPVIMMKYEGETLHGTKEITRKLPLDKLIKPAFMQEAYDLIKIHYADGDKGEDLNEMQRAACLDFINQTAKKMDLRYLLELYELRAMQDIRDFVAKNYPEDLQKEALAIYEEEIQKKAANLVSDVLRQGSYNAAQFLYSNKHQKLLLKTVKPKVAEFKKAMEKANPHIAAWTIAAIEKANDMVEEVNATKGKDEPIAVKLHMGKLAGLLPEMKPFIQKFFGIKL